MKITDIVKNRMSFSFEVFPPKPDKPMQPLIDTLDHLYKFNPDFISVTYGAGGTNRGRNLETCKLVLESGHDALAHLTCIGNHREEVAQMLAQYKTAGVRNILALRGDFPAGWTGTQGDFDYAVDLIRFIKKTDPSFCIDAACCPEKHIEASSMEVDIMHLRSKVDAGADFLTTQLFYDNTAFLDFMERVRRAKIHVPVIVGVMPVLNSASVIRMTTTNGASIPKELSALIAKYGDKPDEFKKAGIDYTIEQIATLVVGGIDGLHLYTMNRWEDVAAIVNGSGLRKYIFKEACA